MELLRSDHAASQRGNFGSLKYLQCLLSDFLAAFHKNVVKYNVLLVAAGTGYTGAYVVGAPKGRVTLMQRNKAIHFQMPGRLLFSRPLYFI